MIPSSSLLSFGLGIPSPIDVCDITTYVVDVKGNLAKNFIRENPPRAGCLSSWKRGRAAGGCPAPPRSGRTGSKSQGRFLVVDSIFLIEARAMNIERVGVVGAGTMGNGIAHVFARSGYSVTLCDLEQQFLERALETIRRNLEREVAKEKITVADKDAALDRIQPVIKREHLADCDFVIEAATEKLEIKTEIFRELDRLTRPQVILASNTSSISITKLGALTGRPEKVVGMHFFNPVQVMKLAEVIRGLATSAETFTTVRELSVKVGKAPVEVND